MSEGSKGTAPRSHGLIRSPQDFWGGLVLVGVAAVRALGVEAICPACAASRSAPAPRRACSPMA